MFLVYAVRVIAIGFMILICADIWSIFESIAFNYATFFISLGLLLLTIGFLGMSQYELLQKPIGAGYFKREKLVHMLPFRRLLVILGNFGLPVLFLGYVVQWLF